MRIALVAEDYYPQLGGVPEHVHNLALQLNAWGHTATVVTSHMGDYPDAPFVRRVGKSRVIYSNGGVSRVTTGWRLRRRLEELFRAGRYDIVHVHGGLAPTFGLAAPFAAWRAGIPVVATFHSWFARSAACRVFRRPLQRVLDRHAATIAVSEPVVDANSRYFRAEWDVIPNGVDTSFFRPNGRRPTDALTDHPRLLFLGRIEPRNGLGTLFEAMACGTPMVVSDNHGFRSVIAGGAEALVIPKDDPAVWAETTIALLGDPARREAMARAGVDKAQRFAWPRIARQELAVYERVL